MASTERAGSGLARGEVRGHGGVDCGGKRCLKQVRQSREASGGARGKARSWSASCSPEKAVEEGRGRCVRWRPLRAATRDPRGGRDVLTGRGGRAPQAASGSRREGSRGVMDGGFRTRCAREPLGGSVGAAAPGLRCWGARGRGASGLAWRVGGRWRRPGLAVGADSVLQGERGAGLGYHCEGRAGRQWEALGGVHQEEPVVSTPWTPACPSFQEKPCRPVRGASRESSHGGGSAGLGGWEAGGPRREMSPPPVLGFRGTTQEQRRPSKASGACCLCPLGQAGGGYLCSALAQAWRWPCCSLQLECG